jgi:hypothetical protein
LLAALLPFFFADCRSWIKGPIAIAVAVSSSATSPCNNDIYSTHSCRVKRPDFGPFVSICIARFFNFLNFLRPTLALEHAEAAGVVVDGVEDNDDTAAFASEAAPVVDFDDDAVTAVDISIVIVLLVLSWRVACDVRNPRYDEVCLHLQHSRDHFSTTIELFIDWSPTLCDDISNTKYIMPDGFQLRIPICLNCPKFLFVNQNEST